MRRLGGQWQEEIMRLRVTEVGLRSRIAEVTTFAAKWRELAQDQGALLEKARTRILETEEVHEFSRRLARLEPCIEADHEDENQRIPYPCPRCAAGEGMA